jgi:hypothetical protein
MYFHVDFLFSSGIRAGCELSINVSIVSASPLATALNAAAPFATVTIIVPWSAINSSVPVSVSQIQVSAFAVSPKFCFSNGVVCIVGVSAKTFLSPFMLSTFSIVEVWLSNSGSPLRFAMSSTLTGSSQGSFNGDQIGVASTVLPFLSLSNLKLRLTVSSSTIQSLQLTGFASFSNINSSSSWVGQASFAIHVYVEPRTGNYGWFIRNMPLTCLDALVALFGGISSGNVKISVTDLVAVAHAFDLVVSTYTNPSMGLTRGVFLTITATTILHPTLIGVFDVNSLSKVLFQLIK